MKTLKIIWTDIGHNEIVGTSEDGEEIFRLNRELVWPYTWVMTGLYNDKDQYRNDLKSRAEYYINEILTK